MDEKEALKQKIAMMKTIMNKPQHDRLAKMEEASVAGLKPLNRQHSSLQKVRVDGSKLLSPATLMGVPLRVLATEGEEINDKEADPFDVSDLIEEDEKRHRMDIKLMDDQYSLLSSNIKVKDGVMKSYQNKAVEYAQIALQYKAQYQSTNEEIEDAERQIVEVRNKLAGSIADSERLRLEQEKASLEKMLSDLNKKLSRLESEKTKLLSMKEQSDRKVQQMDIEIKMMKDQKMALSRKVKHEQSNWKKFQEEQKKEMIRLRLKLKATENKYEKLEAELVMREKEGPSTAATPSAAPTSATGATGTADKKGTKLPVLESRTLNIKKTFSKSAVTVDSRTNTISSNSSNRKSTTSRKTSMDEVAEGASTPSSNTQRSMFPLYSRWLNIGLENMVEDQAVLRSISSQVESCEQLEEKMNLLRKSLASMRERGHAIDLEVEDRLDTIQAELDYRRRKIEETRKLLRNDTVPVDFEAIGINDARAIAKVATLQLIDTRIEMDEMRCELEDLLEELDQERTALGNLENRIPLQELKMQRYKAELEGQHEQQLWFFMNQIQSLKTRLNEYERKFKSATMANDMTTIKSLATQIGRGVSEAEFEELSAQDHEEKALWKELQEVERLREQRYEDLLERNDYLSKLVAEQAQAGIKYAEAKLTIARLQRMVSDLLPVIETIASTNLSTVTSSTTSKDSKASNRQPKGYSTLKAGNEGDIFARLSDPGGFTGMYKAINDDMREKGVGHLGGVKIEVKKKKPKQEMPNEILQSVGTLEGHTSTVYKVLTVDNSVYTCSMDHTIKSWDLEVKKDLVTFADHKGPVRSITVNNDVLISTSEDKTIRMWDLRSAKITKTLPVDSVSMSIQIYEGEQCFFTGHEDGSLRKWDLRNVERPLQVSRKHTGSIVAMISHNGDLVTGSRDRMIYSWSPKEFATKRTFVHHHDSITTLTSWKGALVSGSRDRQIKEYVYDDAGKDVGRFIFASHSDWVNVVSPSPDGQFLISGSKDTTIKVWDSQWMLKAHVLKHDGPVHDFAWYKNGIFLSASHDATCIIHKLKPQE